MRILELYRYRTNFTEALRERGHEVYLVDFDKKAGANFTGTVQEFEAIYDQLNFEDGYFDVVFARPHCITYSPRSRWYHHRQGPGAEPLTDKARWNDEEVQAMLRIIEKVKPKYWFMENPHGDLRKRPFMQGIRVTKISYCQYGWEFMKPTDIFGVYPDGWIKPSCKPRDDCHIHSGDKAVRAAIIKNLENTTWSAVLDHKMKNGTQRAGMPKGLSEAIADCLEQVL